MHCVEMAIGNRKRQIHEWDVSEIACIAFITCKGHHAAQIKTKWFDGRLTDG